MNRKHTIVVWVMAVWISLISLNYGIDEKDPFYLSVPIILLGGLLLYHFRDKNKPTSGNPLTSTLPPLMLALILLQGILLITQHRIIRSVQSDVQSIESDVNTIQSDISSIQSDVSSIESDVSLLHLR